MEEYNSIIPSADNLCQIYGNLVLCFLLPYWPGWRVLGILLESLQFDPVPPGLVPGAPGEHDQDEEDDRVGDDDPGQQAALPVGDQAGVVWQPLGAEAQEKDLYDEKSLLYIEQGVNLLPRFVVNDGAFQRDDDDGNFQQNGNGI